MKYFITIFYVFVSLALMAQAPRLAVKADPVTYNIVEQQDLSIDDIEERIVFTNKRIAVNTEQIEALTAKVDLLKQFKADNAIVLDLMDVVYNKQEEYLPLTPAEQLFIAQYNVPQCAFYSDVISLSQLNYMIVNKQRRIELFQQELECLEGL